MKKWRWITFIIVLVFLLIFVVGHIFESDYQSTTNNTTPFITANPLDLSQIQAISQFRSCEGHNYSGLNAQGVEETYRTMKHYIEAIADLAQSTGQVKVYAPFDGRISDIAKDNRGMQVYLSPSSKDIDWDFLYFHIDLLPPFNKEGITIKAGEHLGFANLHDAANFDIALRSFGFGKQRNDSPFLYMTDNVLDEYATVGITTESIIIPQQTRDASPCKLAPDQSGRNAFYAQEEAGKSWVKLK